MWIVTFIVCISVPWFSGLAGQSIELHPYNSSMTNSICRDGFLLPGDWFLMTATLNATGTSRDEWPADRIILNEIVDSYTVECGFREIKTICEIYIMRDECGKPAPGKCGYCDFEQNDVYHLVFNITATEESFNNARFRTINLTWAGEWKTKLSSNDSNYVPYPYVLGKDFMMYFSVMSYQNVYYVNGSATSRLYDTKVRAQSACVSEGSPGNFGNSTWFLPNKTIQSRHKCLSDDKYDQLITENPLNIQIYFYDGMCARGDSLISSLFHGYVRDVECELKTDKVDNTTWMTWLCNPPTYSLCISPTTVRGILVSNASRIGFCQLDFVKDINDSTLFATYSAKAWKVVEQDTWATSTLSHNFYYEISQHTECTNDTGAYIFTVNESHSVIVRPGDNVTFSCEIYGFPMPNAQLLGPAMRKLTVYEAMVYLMNYTLHNLQCDDSGRYMCKVDRGYGATIEARQKVVDVNVECPPKRNVSETDGQTPTFTYKPEVGIIIEVYGYPEPTHFILRVKVDDFAYQEVDTELYSVMTVPLTPPFFRLNLTFTKHSEHGSNTYVLHVSNGEGNGLDIDFNVTWNESTSESPFVWLIIVVIVSCTLIIITVIVLVAMRKAVLRRCTNASAGKSDESVSYDNVQSRRNNSDFASSGMSTGNENLNTGSAESAGSTSNDHVYSDPYPESDYIDPIPEPDYDTEGVYYTMDKDGYIHHEFR